MSFLVSKYFQFKVKASSDMTVVTENALGLEKGDLVSPDSDIPGLGIAVKFDETSVFKAVKKIVADGGHDEPFFTQASIIEHADSLAEAV